MPPPAAIVEWLRRTYPRPTVNPEWLDACYEWVTTELGLDPANTDALKQQIDIQLLQSDLSDSMMPGTGFPTTLQPTRPARIPGPVLCQIVALTDIGHSAFSLQTTRQTRIDKADMAGLYAEDEEAVEEEGPIPRYPRSMLRLQLSDGSTTVNAFEYRKIPQLVLGETPHGYKRQCFEDNGSDLTEEQMILRNVLVRGGLLFLEPGCVTLKGYAVEELDEHRDRDFIRGLRLRLGHPEPDEDEPLELRPPPPPEAPARAAPAPAAPVRAAPQAAVPQPQREPAPPPTTSPFFSTTPKPPTSDTLAALRRDMSPVSTRDHFPKAPTYDDDAAFEDMFDDDAFMQQVDAPHKENAPPARAGSDIDEDELAMLEAIERENNIAPPPAQEDAFSDIDESMLDALDKLEQNVASSSTMKASSSERAASQQKEIVISIDSDEDMDIKPPPPRPSQRTGTQGRKRKIDEDVIEISD